MNCRTKLIINENDYIPLEDRQKWGEIEVKKVYGPLHCGCINTLVWSEKDHKDALYKAEIKNEKPKQRKGNEIL